MPKQGEIFGMSQDNYAVSVRGRPLDYGQRQPADAARPLTVANLEQVESVRERVKRAMRVAPDRSGQ